MGLLCGLVLCRDMTYCVATATLQGETEACRDRSGWYGVAIQFWCCDRVCWLSGVATEPRPARATVRDCALDNVHDSVRSALELCMRQTCNNALCRALFRSLFGSLFMATVHGYC